MAVSLVETGSQPILTITTEKLSRQHVCFRARTPEINATGYGETEESAVAQMKDSIKDIVSFVAKGDPDKPSTITAKFVQEKLNSGATVEELFSPAKPDNPQLAAAS